MQILSEYLKDKGSKIKDIGTEKVCKCIYCDDKKEHMYINDEKAVFYCHKCGEAGNIWKLKTHYGEFKVNQAVTKKVTYTVPKPETDEAYITKLNALFEGGKDYLKGERGFTEKTIKDFKLGQYENNIAIPYYKDGVLVNFKFRGITEKRFERFKGAESTLYNIDNIDKTKDIIITEGEFDCISAVQMGFTNTISVSVGATSFKPEWIDFFDSCIGKIYIAFDNDEKGDEGADKIASKIGLHKCFRVKLPFKDFNDCLMGGYDSKKIQPFLNSAKGYSLDNLIHVNYIYDRIEKLFRGEGSGRGLQLDGWDSLNEQLGGFRESEVTIFTGDTGSGKTTLTLNFIYGLISQGEGVVVASTEMRTEKVLSKMFSMHLNKSFYDFTEEDLQNCMVWFSSKKLFFIDVHGKLSIETIREYLEYSNRKYDVKFALLDHLHYFIKSGSDSIVGEIEEFMRGVVSVALQTGMHIMLIAHPSKLSNSLGQVSMNDIKGASAIKQDAHNVATIWRDREKEKSKQFEVVFDLQKVRDDAGVGGSKRYLFNPQSQVYTEKTEEVYAGFKQNVERVDRHY